MTTEKRLIDANALTQEIETLRGQYRGKCTGTIYGGYTSALCSIDGANTVDAVEVVRCKDCKAYDKEAYYCEAMGFTCEANDFCSYGERKDND